MSATTPRDELRETIVQAIAAVDPHDANGLSPEEAADAVLALGTVSSFLTTRAGKLGRYYVLETPEVEIDDE